MPKLDQILEQRINDLADNISQALSLIKELEDALHYERDPLSRRRYISDIERLRDSLNKYQQEYVNLRAQIVDGSPTPKMDAVGGQLQQLETRLLQQLESLRTEIISTRQTLLDHYDSRGQKIVASIVEKLTQSQQDNLRTILDAIEKKSVAEGELKPILTEAQKLFQDILQGKTILNDPALPKQVRDLSDAISDPSLDVQHKIKLTLPIIPVLLQYEGEISLGSMMNLRSAWTELLRRIRGE